MVKVAGVVIVSGNNRAAQEPSQTGSHTRAPLPTKEPLRVEACAVSPDAGNMQQEDDGGCECRLGRHNRSDAARHLGALLLLALLAGTRRGRRRTAPA